MTSLTGDAASFLSRGVRVKGQSSPQDVACGLFVSVGGVSARLTGERGLGDSVLSCCVTTVFAAIGGVFWVDLDPGASSVFRFGAQNRDELPPPSVTYASVESGLGGGPIGQERAGLIRIRQRLGTATHVGDRQIFHNKQVIGRNQRPGGLVVEVAALVGDLAVPSSDCLSPVLPVVRTTPCSGQRPLGSGQTRGRTAPPAGVTDVHSVGGGCETGDSHIDTDVPPGGRQRVDGYIVAGQDQRPPPTLAADLDGLDPAENLPVRTDLHLPDALQVDPVGVGIPAGAIAVFGPFHTVESSPALISWIPRCRTGFHTSKESVECAIQPAQRGLLTGKRPCGHIWTVSPNVLELIGLAAVGDGSTAMRPGIPAFLQCRVVQLSMRVNTRRQCDMLACRRPHPKLVSSPHADTASHRSTNSTRLVAICPRRNRRHRFGQRTTRRARAVRSPAERRKRDPCMPAHYEAPPTKPTSTRWSSALIRPMAIVPSPLGGQ